MVKKELEDVIVKLTTAEVQCPNVKKEDTTIYSNYSMQQCQPSEFRA